jgi:hypothetical protein
MSPRPKLRNWRGCSTALATTIRPMLPCGLIVSRQYNHKPRNEVARFISLGAGVQSSTLVEMYVQGDLGDKPLDGVIFADTGDEPEWVYKQVNYLSERLKTTPTPLVIVSTGSLIDDIMTGKKRFASMPLWVISKDTGLPGMLRRQCTSEYKIQPIRSYILNWLLERDHAHIVSRPSRPANRRVKPGTLVTQHIGISLDEFERACQSERDPKWVHNDYPLISKRMRREDCVKYLQERGLRVPNKSSCKRCPYHDDPYWLSLPPNDFEEACVFDDWIRTPEGRKRLNISGLAYLHRSCQPLRAVVFKPNAPDVVKPCVHCMT